MNSGATLRRSILDVKEPDAQADLPLAQSPTATQTKFRPDKYSN